MIVYAVVDDALSPDFPLGDAIETFIRREDAERFVEEVRGDDPEVAAKLRIEERELEAGWRGSRLVRSVAASSWTTRTRRHRAQSQASCRRRSHSQSRDLLPECSRPWSRGRVPSP